jgi:hypothetical protein
MSTQDQTKNIISKDLDPFSIILALYVKISMTRVQSFNIRKNNPQ